MIKHLFKLMPPHFYLSIMFCFSNVYQKKMFFFTISALDAVMNVVV